MKFSKFILTLFISLLSICSFAHPSPNSLIELSFGDNSLYTTVHLPLVELELAINKSFKGDKGFDREEIKSYVLQHIDIQDLEGNLWNKVLIGDVEFEDLESKSPDLVAHLQFNAPNKRALKQFNLHTDLIEHQVHSHKIYVVTKSDWENGLLSKDGEIQGVIKFMKNDLIIRREEGSFLRGFFATFMSGIHHIAEGTDHLLFLLMLLLPAPLAATASPKKWNGYIGAKDSLTALTKIVTAFTIGHSITLFIGSFKIFQLSEQITESLIAASVLISAIHAVKPIFPRAEWFIALIFGLIHGLAFSSIVATFGLSPDKMLASVLGFNLGIEAMQLFLVFMTMPWLYLAASRSYYSFIRVPLALFGVVAATNWLLERTLNFHITVLDQMIGSLQQRYFIIYSALVLASLALYFLDQSAEKVKVARVK